MTSFVVRAASQAVRTARHVHRFAAQAALKPVQGASYSLLARVTVASQTPLSCVGIISPTLKKKVLRLLYIGHARC